MRKNYVLLKQYGLALTLLLTTTIIIYSCKKDLGSSQLSNAELSDLRNWYESNSGKVINDRFQKMKPIWDDVFVSDHDDQIVYELNLVNPDQVFQVINATVVKEKSSTNRNLIKLLIFKNKKTSKIDYGVYQSILNEGSLLNLEQLHYKQMNGLSGKVMYYNFDGSFSNGWNYASGEVTNSIQPIEQSIYLNAQLDRLSRNQQKGTSSKEKLQLAYPDECIGKITEYGVACAGVEGYMVCNVYEKGSSYFNACGGGNGKGGNSGGYQPPGGGGTPYFDCAGVKNGKAIESPCGCIGGTTGLESCGQKELNTDSLKTKYPCADKLILQPIFNSASMNEFVKPFLTAQKPTITYKTSNNLAWGNTTTGGAFMLGNTIYDPNSGLNRSTIVTLNEKMLENSSPLLIASTTVHETIHSYIYYNVSLADYNVNSIYKDNNNWMAALNGFYAIKDLPPNYSNHTLMLTDYFDKSIAVLQTWNNTQTTPYSTKELAMAMMYGLDTVDPGTPQNFIDNVNSAFAAIQAKYGITAAERNTFNLANLNSNNKLSTTGCN